MRTKPPRFVKAHFMPAAILVVCMLFVGGRLAQSTVQSPSGREEGLKKFLQSYEGKPASANERNTRYSAAFVDLKDDGTEEVIVYLLSPDWCGSGGCSVLILEPAGGSYKIITRTTVRNLPFASYPRKQMAGTI